MAVIVKGKNPNKPWTVRYQHEGRQREKSFRTATEARGFKAKFEHDSREHSFTDPRAGKVTFLDAATRYIAGMDCAANTRAAYTTSLRSNVGPVLGSRTLASLAQDREAVTGLITSVKEAKSASTANTARSLILGVMNEAKRAGKIGSHRLDGIAVRRDEVKPAEIIPCTTGQLEALAGGMPADLSLMIWLMRGCGLRISETMAVKITGFRDNGHGKVLRVTEHASRDGGYAPLKGRRAGEYRDIPCPGWLWAKVEGHVVDHGTHDGYLFRRVSYHGVSDPLGRAAKAAGLPESFTPHSLRHMFASVLLSAGVPLTDVSAWLGHRDVNVTYQTYSHLIPDAWERGRAALETL